MAKKQLFIEITEDGDIKLDASKMPGTEQDILDLLNAIALEVGGDPATLKVEQHIHKHQHGHTHAGDHVHTHG